MQDSLRGAWGLDDDDEVWTPTSALDADTTDEFGDAVRRAFNNDLFQLARVFRLPAPHYSNVVALTQRALSGIMSGILCRPPFFIPRIIMRIRARRRRAPQLLDEWEDEQSDARFAWNWASWSGDERLRQLSGIPQYFAALERQMKLILRASTALWRANERLHGTFARGPNARIWRNIRANSFPSI